MRARQRALTVAAAIAIVIGGAAATAHWKRATRAANAEADRLRAQLAVKDEQIADLERRLKAVAASLLSPSPVAPRRIAQAEGVERPLAPSARVEADNGAAGPRSPESIFAERRAQVNELAARVEEEKVDAAWASQAEARVRNIAKHLGDRVELREVSCRTTLCRAVFQHNDMTSRSEAMQELMAAGEGGGQTLIDVPIEAEDTSVLYFSRENHEFGLF